MIKNSRSVGLLLVAGLFGCGSSGDDELRQWMADLRTNTKPQVTPLTEPKRFMPQAYSMTSGEEPFSPNKLTQALRKDSTQHASNAALIAPEMSRRKEPL